MAKTIEEKRKYMREYMRVWYAALSKEKRNEINAKRRIYSKKYRAEDPQKKKAFSARWYKNNKEKARATGVKWRKANPEKRKAAYHRRLQNPQIRLCRAMSRGIWNSLKLGKAGQHWENFVDYTIDDLIKHLEQLFQPDMTLENYGTWHVDHKIPQKVFNFTKPTHEDFKRCWALSNLQPLWAAENRSKGDRLDKPFQPSLALEV